MLEIKNIGFKSDDGKSIVDDISLTVPDKKIIAITGPNGGGKSSLAKLIAGIYAPSQGKIFLDGEDISDLDITERAKKGISFAFQRPVCFKGFTVRDMLSIAAGRELSDDELKDLLWTVGLCMLDYADREINMNLSGGEQKRVEIAGVLARGTRLNIFDEPEAGIDIWSFQKLIDVFKNLKTVSNATQLIITHQRGILEIADEIIVITDGKIAVSGAPEDILPTLFNMDSSVSCPVGKRCK